MITIFLSYYAPDLPNLHFHRHHHPCLRHHHHDDYLDRAIDVVEYVVFVLIIEILLKQYDYEFTLQPIQLLLFIVEIIF